MNLLTFFGLGKIKFSASIASALAAILYIGLDLVFQEKLFTVHVIFWIVLFSVTLLVFHLNEIKNDPSSIIIDEFLGMYAALIAAYHPSLKECIFLFILFRILDILKPPPFNLLDKKDNKWMILADDIAIGIVAGCVSFAAKYYSAAYSEFLK